MADLHTAPDRTFQVLIPEGRVKHTPPNSRELNNTFIANGVAVYFFGDQHDSGFFRFSVYVFDFSNKEFRKRKEHPEWIRYFATMALGDDDEPQFLSGAKHIQASGLLGNEFAYVVDGQRKRFSRGWFFDVRNKLYVLSFEARSIGDLQSLEGDKFLRSFKLRLNSRHL